MYIYTKKRQKTSSICVKSPSLAPYPSPAASGKLLLMQAQKLPYGTVVAAADIKNHPHFIIILLSADSLLVDIYIFSWVRHVIYRECFLPCTNIPPAIMIYYIILLPNICDFTDSNHYFVYTTC